MSAVPPSAVGERREGEAENRPSCYRRDRGGRAGGGQCGCWRGFGADGFTVGLQLVMLAPAHGALWCSTLLRNEMFPLDHRVPLVSVSTVRSPRVRIEPGNIFHWLDVSAPGTSPLSLTRDVR